MPLWSLDDSLHLGEIIKPHSYLGSVKVAILFNGLDQVIRPKKFLFIEFMSKPVPFYIESVQWLNDTAALIKFADVNSDISAENLRNRNVFISKKDIPSKLLKRILMNSSEFEGFEIRDEHGQSLGIVEAMIDQAIQPLLEVSYQNKTYLIPIHENIILDVLTDEKILIVDLPQGLMEIN